MPSKSKQQQKFMGMTHALKKGEMKPSDASPEMKEGIINSSLPKPERDGIPTQINGLSPIGSVIIP